MNRVKEFRKELGISQLELAKDIGVSRQTINHELKTTSTTQLWNSVSISPAASKLTSTVSFGRMIFKKGANSWKRNLHWKTNQTHLWHFWPLDEHKRREADRIGNKIFVILFYLMT